MTIKIAMGLDNADFRIYHTRSLLTPGFRTFYPEMPPGEQPALTSLGQDIAHLLDAITGVDGYGLCRYRVSIVKGGAFTWEEVEASVLQVLEGG